MRVHVYKIFCMLNKTLILNICFLETDSGCLHYFYLPSPLSAMLVTLLQVKRFVTFSSSQCSRWLRGGPWARPGQSRPGWSPTSTLLVRGVSLRRGSASHLGGLSPLFNLPPLLLNKGWVKPLGCYLTSLQNSGLQKT